MKNFFASLKGMGVLVLVMCCGVGWGQQPTLAWAKGMGGIRQELGRGVAVDASGNSYTIGVFGNTVDFDPGPSVFNLTSKGIWDYDIFILKLDASGNFVWAKQLGGNGDDWGYAITLDDSSNIYTTGFYRGSSDFDPGPATYNLSGGGGFISKLDSGGNFIWAKQLGGLGYSIKLDASGNIYTTGNFGGTVDFDPGVGVHNLTSTQDAGVFICKLNSSGDFVWATFTGGIFGNSLAVDNYRNVYVTGRFSGYPDFDAGPADYRISTQGDNDIFVAKIDSAGIFKWAEGFGSNLSDAGNSITTDKSGNIIFTGTFQQTVDFDPGPQVYNLSTGINPTSIFIAKLDASGSFIWAKGIEGYSAHSGNSCQGYSVVTDMQNNIYTTGQVSSDADFDPGPDTFMVPSTGVSAFVLKLDSAGQFKWAYNMGDYASGSSISVDSHGSVYSTGFHQGGNFDPFSNSIFLSTAGYEDFYVVKWGQSSLSLHLLTFTAKRANTANLLNWTTAQEVNTDRFDIERSPNGTQFSKIGTVKANSINGKYEYTDNQTRNEKQETVVFYRLKMLDKDGQFTYSPIRQINIKHSTFNIVLFPNPAKDILQLQIESNQKATLNLQVLAQDGKIVLSKQLTVQQGSSLQSLNISQLAAGHYFLHVFPADKEPVVAGFEKIK